MENQQQNIHEDEIDGEEIHEDFQCCVCLDLFYKPVVLACGHIACFWCVFKSMDNWQQSHCMVCRYPYGHFPRVCKLLHYLLLKLYPLSYRRRERQVSEEEKEVGYVSPQFGDYLSEIRVLEEMDGRETNLTNYTVNAHKSGSSGEREPSTSGMKKAAVSEDCKINFLPRINHETTSKVAIQENVAKDNGIIDGDRKRVLMTDLLCSLCKQLLFRPVVLNCGDVFCETCIISDRDKVHRCPVCHSAHPTGFPNVCLVLEHFLNDQFPEEYEVRKQSLAKEMDDQRVSQSTCLTFFAVVLYNLFNLISGSKQNQADTSKCSSMPPNFYSSWLAGQGPKVHFGVGCDYCGMCPIVGERYKCKDCVEKIGFDLCEQCYQSSSKLPGRFNQQHTEDHKFENVQPVHLTELIILRGEAETFEDNDSDDPEDTEEVSLAPLSSEDAEHHDIEDGAEALPSLNDISENQQSSDSRT